MTDRLTDAELDELEQACKLLDEHDVAVSVWLRHPNGLNEAGGPADPTNKDFLAAFKVVEALPAVIKELRELRAARDKLQAFKDYVHQRLDDSDIPTHPDGPHSQKGCRIGDRLDIALASCAENARLREVRDTAIAERDEAVGLLRAVAPHCGELICYASDADSHHVPELLDFVARLKAFLARIDSEKTDD